jgi:glucokinase
VLLLAEPLLKRLHKEDADAGCRLLLEALIGLHEAQLQLQQKTQDVVSKVSSSSCYRSRQTLSGFCSYLVTCLCCSLDLQLLQSGSMHA